VKPRDLTFALVQPWLRLGPRFLPFADAASTELPLGRLLRLSLFQFSVGMATALLVGTLNRVMIVEMGVAAWLVALMVSLPVLSAPFRAFVGFRSDTYRSPLGWRRVPFVWFGSLLQFGGLAIMPFALLILSGDAVNGPAWIGHVGAALAILLVGAGMQTTQTAGLALATDLAPEATRPRVVALMYVMLLLGMVCSGLAFGALLSDFSSKRLIQVVQGAAVVTAILNLVAVWKQEPRDPNRGKAKVEREFLPMWRAFIQNRRARRFLWAVGLGTAAFNMQDIVLEPYGGEILHLSVSATTTLTALLAGGALCAFFLAARSLARGTDPYRVAAYGALAGLPAFAAVIFAAPLESEWLFRAGATLIGFGGGLFAVGTLTAAMGMDERDHVGLALGAWGAIQATAAGISIAAGGAIRDIISTLASEGLLGEALTTSATGYSFVYHIEMYLLFATLVAIGPLVRPSGQARPAAQSKFGLADYPG
jgi:BCD family chlorophyll transporter-like MFS transporter